MMDYDGEDRRKDSTEFKVSLIRRLDQIGFDCKLLQKELAGLTERVEHANLNTKAFKTLIDEDMQEVKIAIQGNESKGIEGMAAKVTRFAKVLSDHVNQDFWAYGIMISILLSTLGWTMFRVH